MGALHRIEASKLKGLPPGKHCDGGGLYLVKHRDGRANWVFRYSIYGSRKEMGLGKLSNVQLKDARKAANRWRQELELGRNPISVRNQERREANRADQTLEAIAEAAYEAKKPELKDGGEAGRWMSPLTLHVLPKLGKVPVQEIDQQDIATALKKLWKEKPPTAKKAIRRLGIVLKHAFAMGLDVDPTVIDKAKILLGQPMHQEKHIPSIPWPDVPKFYASLEDETVVVLALKLLILTVVRSGPLRKAKWNQFDGAVWTIPAEAMKGQKNKTSPLRVPLSDEAMRVLQVVKPFARDGFVFPGERRGCISDQSMSMLMIRSKAGGRPHGFRSSFDTWCAETQNVSSQVTKAALSHTFETKVGQAYRRTDFLELRTPLMQSWANYVTGRSGNNADH